MSQVSIERIVFLLMGEYGGRKWQQQHSPLSVLIQTILSQNTTDINSDRAFESLSASFDTWEDLIEASVTEIAASIKGGGLGAIKAKRIKEALGEIERKRGRLELNFLKELPLDEARDWLKHLPGVGSKTANCVLLFSLGKPALPVDTHVFRVAKRLRLINPKASTEQAHKLLEKVVPSNKVYDFHMLFIEHGRKVCKAQRPRCTQCVLRRICPSYEQFVGKNEWK